VSRGCGLVQQHGELLRRNLLFAGLDGVTLAKLAARLEVVRLDDGDHVMRLGEVGDAMYVISRGHFGVFAPGPAGGGEERLRTCSQGDVVGEMALLTGQPRSASVRAEGEGEVLRLDRQHFDGLVRQNPSVPLALAATLSSRLGNAPATGQGSEVRGQGSVGSKAAAPPVASRTAFGFVLAALLLAGGWLVPQPDGFTREGWHAAATFLAIVPLMAFGCLPDGAIALVLVAAWVVSGVATPTVALAGFASGTWVLTIAVFIVGAVITSSGLLFRLALWSVEHARGGFKTQVAALSIAGVLSSAAVPNPSGRMLLVAPAIGEMVDAFGYAPGSRPAAGLAMAALLGFGQTVAPFLTSSTTTLLTFTLVPDASRAGLDWGTWAVRAAPTYGVLLLGMLAFIVWRYSPREAAPRRVDALPVQRALLGPTSRQEWIVGVVALALLVGFATQPLHHLDPAWVSVAALGVLAAFGLVTPDTLRSVNWNYALLFGTLASAVDVFSTTSLDRSVGGLIAGVVGGRVGSPVAFVAILTLVCFAASFVLRFAAAAPLLTVSLAPVAATMGIDPWVVAITALLATSGFFLPFQSTIYQAIHQELEGRLFSHRQVRSVALMYGVMTLVALCSSVPVWHLMGLL
jgi:DASS family divalent anion:Na+ symporter